MAKYQKDLAKDSDQITKRPPKRGQKNQGSKRTNASSYRSNDRFNIADKKERFSAAEKANAWKSAGNDPKWYNQFPDELRNFTGFNFRAPVGSQVILSDQTGWEGFSADRYPGVMALYFTPSAGCKDEMNASMLNLAANRLYQFTRFENNGSSKYDRGALMLYFMAMDSCYTYHAWLKRIYSEMHTFSNMNRYMPRALMRAERVDYDDLEKKLPKLRGWINQYAEKLAILPIPHSISYMARHAWMANSIFTDTDTYKCQFYLYVPFYFQVFNLADGTGTLPAGTPWLQYVAPTYGNNGYTLDDLINFGNSLLDPLVNNEDFNNIGADVLKAFGSTGVVVLDAIPDDYRVLPTHSDEVLDQIQNATPIGHPASMGSLILPAQNNGASIYWDATTNALVPNDEVWVPFDVTQTYQLYASPYRLNRLINFERNEITNDDIMVATRLANICEEPKTVVGNDGQSYLKMQVKTLGSEYVSQISMFFFTTSDTGQWRIGNTTLGYFARPLSNVMPWGDVNTSAADWVANEVVAAKESILLTRDTTRFNQCLSQFNRHPYIMEYGFDVFVENDGADNPVYRGQTIHAYGKDARIIGDTANFAVFTKEDLIDLSAVALQSEFFAPLTASGAVKVTAI